MANANEPPSAPPERRRRLLDRVDLACLAWAGLFGVLTGVLVVVLR